MFEQIVESLRSSRGIAAKTDIARVADQLGFTANDTIRVGDDCAAIPDGDGYLLLAIEGFINEFVAADPWFAGWCGVMVNVSDIAAMGGRPIAVVNAIWSAGDAADPILQGLRAASETFAVPLVGGHTNLRTDRSQLSVAILGRAKRLLTSFDAQPGDRLDRGHRSARPLPRPFSKLGSRHRTRPRLRLRQDIEILPLIAEAGLSKAAKDISQGGIIGTAMMLADCSSVGLNIDLNAIPRPDAAPLDRWLQTFPSFGYILTTTDAPAVIARFAERGIHAADIGLVTSERTVRVTLAAASETIWDFSRQTLLGCAHA